MKASSQANILMLFGAGCIFATILQKPLGLPDWAGFVLQLTGGLFILMAVWLPRRAMKRGDLPVVPLTPQQYKKRQRLVLMMIVVGSLTSPFYLPYTGVTLPFYQLVICSLVSGTVCVGAVLWSMRRSRPKV